MLLQAINWAEREFGTGSVFAARPALDESGACVVDLLIAPVRMMRSGLGLAPRISVARALEEIAERHGQPVAKSFSALNDGWTKWAQQRIDPALQRGKPKSETGREHFNADVYKRQAQIEKTEVEAEIARQAKRFKSLSKATRKAQGIYQRLRQAITKAEGLLAQLKTPGDAAQRLAELEKREGMLDAIWKWNRAELTQQVTRPTGGQGIKR